MDFAKTVQWMNRKDNRPPPGVGKMKVRKTATKSFANGFKVTMETSCGNDRPHIAGSVKLELDAPGFPKPITKRFQVDNYREADTEYRKLVAMIRNGDDFLA